MTFERIRRLLSLLIDGPKRCSTCGSQLIFPDDIARGSCWRHDMLPTTAKPDGFAPPGQGLIRLCDRCGHRDDQHPYRLDFDRSGRGPCTVYQCDCTGYRYNPTLRRATAGDAASVSEERPVFHRQIKRQRKISRVRCDGVAFMARVSGTSVIWQKTDTCGACGRPIAIQDLDFGQVFKMEPQTMAPANTTPRYHGPKGTPITEVDIASCRVLRKVVDVGCERPDGTLNVHSETETCDVCRAAVIDASHRSDGPPRWICKRCGKPRRRSECLSCGNLEPLTDEPPTSGIVR